MVAESEPYDPAISVDVKRWLRLGDNRIVIQASGVEGPSAVALDLAFVQESDGSRNVVVVSDGRWEGADSIAPLASLQLGTSHLKEIGALDEYNQWKEAKGSDDTSTPAPQFSSLPDGFKLQQLRVAKKHEGSWVSMAFDQKGRLLVAKEKRGLLRLLLSEDGDIRSVETINDTLLECRGFWLSMARSMPMPTTRKPCTVYAIPVVTISMTMSNR